MTVAHQYPRKYSLEGGQLGAAQLAGLVACSSLDEGCRNTGGGGGRWAVRPHPLSPGPAHWSTPPGRVQARVPVRPATRRVIREEERRRGLPEHFISGHQDQT